MVGINTAWPNRIVEEAVTAQLVPELAGYPSLRREVPYGRNSRIDLLLEAADRPPCYLEVKNVHLRRTAGLAEFPDSVTKRGAKHLRELSEMADRGARAVMFFLVQRGDCTSFQVAADIDPDYDRALHAALDHGVEVLCYSCRVGEEAIELDRPLPVTI
jgi:sugar fermentation stimulation protein A